MPKSRRPGGRGRYRSRDKTGRERIKGLYLRAGNAEKRREPGHLTRRHSPPSVPHTAARAVRRYGIFAERLFLIDAIQTSRPPGALVKLFVAFRVASRDIRSSGFTPGADPSFALITEKHSRRGHSWDASSFLGSVLELCQSLGE